MQEHEAARKSSEKTRMAAPKCATERKVRHLCRTKSIDLIIFKEQKTVEQQPLDLTTFRSEASSGKRNERQYEKAHEIIKENR